MLKSNIKFAIISHAVHKIKEDKIYAYEPYVREMNLWLKFVSEVIIIAPFEDADVNPVETNYNHQKITIVKIPAINILNVKSIILTIVKLPNILKNIYKAMQWADHIHLRCPGNIGLLGCLVQIMFPKKPKTVKYAGNWDPNSKQPLSYRLQKWIVSNTFLTKNCQVLVYGEWPNQTKNIKPFFTASYSDEEIFERHPQHDEIDCHPYSDRHPQIDWGCHDLENEKQMLNQVQHDGTERHPQLDWGSHDLENEKQMLNQVQHDGINRHSVLDTVSHDAELKFIFVGALTKGKQPLLSVKVVHEFIKKGYNVQLDVYGEGEERENIANYILDNSLESVVCLHGNASKDIVKKAYQEAHFLLFISKSEGWPKVVAEAMFWGCLPITSKVSCIPYMLDQGNRGAIVNANVDEIVSVIEDYIQNIDKYTVQVNKAMEWSRQFTLEKFEEEIGKLLEPSSSA